MASKYLVEIGRVVLIDFGPDSGKLAVIVDVIDQNRALIDGTPSGVKRQAIQFKRIRLTKFKLPISFGTSSAIVQREWKKLQIDENFAKTKVAMHLRQRKMKSSMTDFDRFKLYKTRQRYNRIVNKKFLLLKSKSKAKTEKSKSKK
ncbi:60S ribosomal protein L14 [Sarcoptes scabiei]|uniref:Large ribosomal subunit protein eL14 n=1 Tax=Sarcoptes scabiei TaxID=52283 RepID=A0A834VE26_SARSC|nr:60S ribosomal protein L14 [Sarcoptes scabiei]UXI18694.1 acyl-CoA dehydrogenase [Sarcoptes scabiei]